MPHALRVLTLVVVALILGAGMGALALPAQAEPGVVSTPGALADTADLEVFEKRVLARVNRARARHDVPRVRRFQPCVDGLSERWARRIKATGEFVHRDQEAFLDRCDLTWTGENLVRGSGLSPAMAVRAWLDSPSHRAVLLKKRARWAGVGVRVDSDGRVIGVLNFGDPT